MRFSWTVDNVMRLKRLADGTRSAAEIASELGCPRNAVMGKLHRSKGALGRLSPKAGGNPNRKAAAPKPSARVATFNPQARKAEREASPGLKALPPSTATSDPITFRAAIDAGCRCLFYAGDPMGPDGPDMLVCGEVVADRDAMPGDRKRSHCALHVRIASTGPGARLDGLARRA